MKYNIIITKVETKPVMETGPWAVVGTRPWKEEDFRDATPHYGDMKELLARNPLVEIRGYAPDRMVQQETTSIVFKQSVAELDLAAVIKAVNGI